MTSSKRSKRSTKKTAEKRLVIILCGLAGSGKSTTAKMLSRKLRIPRISAGDIFRAIARERKMNLIDLGRYAEAHPQFDKDLDIRLLAEAKKRSVILDGRAAGFLSRKYRIPALKVWLGVDPKVSAARVAKREGIPPAEALRQSRKREREIARRLKALYGLDTSDTSYYDVVIQTDDYAPEEVVDIIYHLARYDRT